MNGMNLAAIFTGASRLGVGGVLSIDAANYDSGVVMPDSSGNGHDGTLVNGAGYGAGNGGHYDFDGVNDYATFSAITELNGLTNLTLEVWMKKDLTGAMMTVGAEKDADNGFWITYWTDNNLYYVFRNANGSTGLQSYARSYDSNYFQAVLSVGGSVATAYIDGVSQGSFACSADLPSDIATYMKCCKTGSNYGDGEVAVVNIWNQTYSDSEVLDLFNYRKSRFGL